MRKTVAQRVDLLDRLIPHNDSWLTRAMVMDWIRDALQETAAQAKEEGWEEAGKVLADMQTDSEAYKLGILALHNALARVAHRKLTSPDGGVRLSAQMLAAAVQEAVELLPEEVRPPGSLKKAPPSSLESQNTPQVI